MHGLSPNDCCISRAGPPASIIFNAQIPKLISLGGDHSIALAALRGLNEIYGPVAVLHFDAHLDTWHPAKYPDPWQSDQTHYNHGSMFWIASNEGLILNGSSVHAGLRTRLSGDGWEDHEDDDRQGFLRINADDLDDFGGLKSVIKRIISRIGTDTLSTSLLISMGLTRVSRLGPGPRSPGGGLRES
jgi:arginase family enzyme